MSRKRKSPVLVKEDKEEEEGSVLTLAASEAQTPSSGVSARVFSPPSRSCEGVTSPPSKMSGGVTFPPMVVPSVSQATSPDLSHANPPGLVGSAKSGGVGGVVGNKRARIGERKEGKTTASVGCRSGEEVEEEGGEGSSEGEEEFESGMSVFLAMAREYGVETTSSVCEKGKGKGVVERNEEEEEEEEESGRTYVHTVEMR